MLKASPPGSGAQTGAASLPMYDWPEIRDATDALWTGICTRLSGLDIDAPADLDRISDLHSVWTNPHLILSQTCGFPFANSLSEDVALIGTPAYAIPDAAPGRYYSVLLTRRSDRPTRLAELVNMRMAFNMAHSQSGFAAPVRLLAANNPASGPEPLETGAHRESVRAVAEGRADWAAIDAVAWELAKRHEPAARELCAIARTPETPGLPLIAGARLVECVGPIADAVEAAIQGIRPAVADALLLSGFSRSTPADYAPLALPLPVSEALPGYKPGC